MRSATARGTSKGISKMFPALCFVLIARILISKGQGTDQEFRNYEDIYVPKGRNYFLNATSNITVANTTCGYHEVHVVILKTNSTEENVSPSRLASIPLQELKPQSIVGVIAKDTQQKFQLGNVSFLSTVTKRNNSHGEFELHLKLEIGIPEAATNHPLFDEIEFVGRCLNRSDVNSLATRHEAGHYRLVYIETGEGPTINSTTITLQASQSLGLPATPSPDPGSAEEKKNPPGQGPNLSGTTITQASQSLGLPATPSPDPEKKNHPYPGEKRKTDRSLALYFVLAGLVISPVIWFSFLKLSNFRRSRKVFAPGEP